MNCQRCLNNVEAKYRVYSDLVDIKVCPACADEARRLGIAVEALDCRVETPDEGKSNFAIHSYRMKLSA